MAGRGRRSDTGGHGSAQASGLAVASYNLALREPEGDGFIGDSASQTAFRALLDQARRQRTGDDPFGRTPTREVPKQDIDLVLVGGDADAAHVVHRAVDAYAANLARVVRCFLQQPAWQGVRRIVLGGGFPDSRVGALAVRCADRLLRQASSGVRLSLLEHDPDEAALLGWVALLPRGIARHAAFLAVDVGGTKIRCGIVEHGLDQAADGRQARVVESMQWRHATDAPQREEAIDRLAGMLNGLHALARTTGIDLAPFVGIACPGQIEADGTISRGAQNLPGDWESPFHLPGAVAARLDRIDGRTPQVTLHNDAVMQGLSARNAVGDAARWGILTIGTGLGNASFHRL